MLKRPPGCNGKLALAENKHKEATKTKSVEMSKIVMNLQINLHHCLCESNWKK